MSLPNPADSGPSPSACAALRIFQKHYGLTNKATAEMLGCSLPTIQKWRSGAISPPATALRLVSLLDALAQGKQEALQRIAEKMTKPCQPPDSLPLKKFLAQTTSCNPDPPEGLDSAASSPPRALSEEHPLTAAPATIPPLIEGAGLCLKADACYLLQRFDEGSVLCKTHEWHRAEVPSPLKTFPRTAPEVAQWLLEEFDGSDQIRIIEPSERHQRDKNRDLCSAQHVGPVALIPVRHASTLLGFFGVELPSEPSLPPPLRDDILKLAAHAIASVLALEDQNHLHRTTEQELLKTLEAADLFFWRWDLKASRIWIDERFFALLGRAPPPENPIPLAHWRELVHPEDRERLNPETWSSPSEANDPIKCTYRMVHSDGSVICLLNRRTEVLRDEQNTPLAVSGSLLDITKVRAKEQSLRESLHDAELANISRMRFLASVSHELMTPLNGILGMGQLLQESALLPEQVEMAGTVIDSGRSLQTLIEDILLFSSLDAGDAKLDP